MATTSQEQVIQLQSQLISTKLSDSNYLVWRQQVLTAIRGYGLLGYINGTVAMPPEYTPGTSGNNVLNPAYSTWTRQDQLLASWLLSSLSDSILIFTVGFNTSKEIRESLETTFASQNSTKLMQYRLQLQTTKKGSMSMREYFNKKALAYLSISALIQILTKEGEVHMVVEEEMHLKDLEAEAGVEIQEEEVA
ncbi:hypothetical protein DH2020_013353 [Rehmannia glutinosa]|uniref:Retrotransposon Copia-like N-terminal domain-containing protein n=1 Tax=Rehmannia glutinosa TaxID=99300 RepID=A0ABR0X2R9_REHGL